MPILARYMLPVALTASSTTATPNQLGLADLSSNNVEFVLPTTKEMGDRVGLKLLTASGTRTATLTRDGSNTIEGLTSIVLYIAGDYIEVEWTGSTWIIVQDGRQLHMAKMRNTTGQQLTGSAAGLVFTNTDYDTAGLVSGNTFVVRKAGKYTVKAFGRMGNFGSGTFLIINIRVNTTEVEALFTYSSAAGAAVTASPLWKGSLSASDSIDFQAQQTSGGNRTFVLSGAGGDVYAAITEIR